MLKTQTANLSPDQLKLVHADFIADERAYLQMRPSLLKSHHGQWVAVKNGKVVSAGPNLLAVMEQATAGGGHPYVALVGAEDAVVFRVRRAVFAYDQSYQPFPLPRVTTIFSNHARTHAQQYPDVIPDTGADASVLPDWQAINLFTLPYITGMAGGVIGPSVAALLYHGYAEIDGRRSSALIQPASGASERIVGRDVLNQQRVLFDGPAAQVVVDP